MNPQLILYIENGKLVHTVADGTIRLHVVNLDELDPHTEIEPRCVTRGELQNLLGGVKHLKPADACTTVTHSNH